MKDRIVTQPTCPAPWVITLSTSHSRTSFCFLYPDWTLRTSTSFHLLWPTRKDLLFNFSTCFWRMPLLTTIFAEFLLAFLANSSFLGWVDCYNWGTLRIGAELLDRGKHNLLIFFKSFIFFGCLIISYIFYLFII